MASSSLFLADVVANAWRTNTFPQRKKRVTPHNYAAACGPHAEIGREQRQKQHAPQQQQRASVEIPVVVTVQHVHRHEFLGSAPENIEVNRQADNLIRIAESMGPPPPPQQQQQRQSSDALRAVNTLAIAATFRNIGDTHHTTTTTTFANAQQLAARALRNAPVFNDDVDGDVDLSRPAQRAPVFESSHDNDALFNDLNWAPTGLPAEQRTTGRASRQVSAPARHEAVAAHNEFNLRTLRRNNGTLRTRSLGQKALRVDVRSLGRAHVSEINNLASDESLSARQLAAYWHTLARNSTRSTSPPRSTPTPPPMPPVLHPDDTSADRGRWRVIYETLRRVGNTSLVVVAGADAFASTSSVSELAERHVRASRYRKAYFAPRQSATSTSSHVWLSGSMSVLSMCENSSLFLLPNSAMWSAEMERTFRHVGNEDFDEFVRFERARHALLAQDPFATDVGWTAWRGAFACTALCRASTHAQCVERPRAAAESTPNVRYFEPREALSSSSSSPPPPPSNECACAQNGTIVLCSRATHRHTLRGRASPTPGQRACADNQCVVAARVFGAATRDRWQALCVLCEAFVPRAPHAPSLIRAFLNAMGADEHLAQLLPCLLEFGVDDADENRVGKEHDRPDELLRGLVGREALLSGDSYARERFSLADPVQLTLALALFVEARMTAGWLNAWLLWSEVVRRHCEACPFCARALAASLQRLVVYNAMLPMLPLSMGLMLEELLARTRCDIKRFLF